MLLLHPQWSRSCDDCRKWVHGDNGKPMVFRGLPMARPKGSTLPCRDCPKIPDGQPKHWVYAEELSDRNYQCWQHYLECRAVGRFPEDPLVRRHAAMIRSLEDAAADRGVCARLDSLSQILGVFCGIVGSTGQARH